AQVPTPRKLAVELYDGDTLEAAASAERDVWALHLGAPLAEWLDQRGAMKGDDLIIGVEDAIAGRYTFRLQPREIRDEEVIARRNQALALAAEEIGEELLSRRSTLYTWELVARLIAGGAFSDSTPPDDMHFVLSEYSRLHLV